jgi:DNA-binding NtrC family response regulator
MGETAGCVDTRSAAYSARQRDRRQALGDLLAALTRGLDRKSDVSLLRGSFEQMLRRIVPVRSVELRERSSRWTSRPETMTGTESISIEVPGSDPAVPNVLEATFDPGCPLGEWDFQMLSLSSHVAALVLEIERNRLELARAGLTSAVKPRRDSPLPMVGMTAAMAELRSAIERVAQTDFTVLLEGESGSGKELVAQQIHHLSRRRSGPFVALNCAALVETLLESELFGIEDRTATGVRGRRGKFEHADGGTLFLDEVSDLSPSAQAKLLRAIQDLSVERVGGQGAHRVDIRIVAATNRSLATLVERGAFRADLYYRLSGVDLRVPPLRERPDDILALARHFLDRHRFTRPLKLSSAAADVLIGYAWPGNVRELERTIEYVVAMAATDVIRIEDLPPTVRGDFGLVLLPSLQRDDSMRAWGSRYARIVLERCGGNKREASRILGISYHTLRSYLAFPNGGGVGEPAPGLIDEPRDREDDEALTAPDAHSTVTRSARHDPRIDGTSHRAAPQDHATQPTPP